MTFFAAVPGFGRQIGLGLAIFAAVTAVSLPLALVSEQLALGAAVAVGGVFVALFARRLRIALLIAALMAVLGAFGATHSIHLSRGDAADLRNLAAIAPSAGPARGQPEGVAAAVTRSGALQPAALMLPSRIAATGGDGRRVSVAAPSGWALPAMLFALWVLAYAAVLSGRYLLRRVWRSIEALV